MWLAEKGLTWAIFCLDFGGNLINTEFIKWMGKWMGKANGRFFMIHHSYKVFATSKLEIVQEIGEEAD
ncbi:MAG: hypothetical protein HQK60_15070 [Deltaproteobacteria bacterium]|nr:hypothetical protein [Deltaproteobacteria bacterium]